MLYEKIREQLRRKEDQYSKEVEMKQQLELTLRALDGTEDRNDLNQCLSRLWKQHMTLRSSLLENGMPESYRRES